MASFERLVALLTKQKNVYLKESELKIFARFFVLNKMNFVNVSVI